MDEKDEAARTAELAEVTRVLVEHRDAFVAFLERRLGSSEIAAEMFQDTFARSLEKIGQLRDPDAAIAWFYQALRNALTDRQRRHAAAERALTQFAREADAIGNAAASEVSAATCACVLRELDALKPEYTDALREIEVAGTAVKDFAERRGISASNAGVRVHRAREALGRRVRATCGSCATEGCVSCTCSSPPKQ